VIAERFQLGMAERDNGEPVRGGRTTQAPDLATHLDQPLDVQLGIPSPRMAWMSNFFRVLAALLEWVLGSYSERTRRCRRRRVPARTAPRTGHN
jgi:hypothetical protein